MTIVFANDTLIAFCKTTHLLPVGLKYQLPNDFDLYISDPAHVIGLYPNLLPQQYRNNLSYPKDVPDLQGTEHEKGIMSLIEYLTQVSSSFLIKKKCSTHHMQYDPIFASDLARNQFVMGIILF